VTLHAASASLDVTSARTASDRRPTPARGRPPTRVSTLLAVIALAVALAWLMTKALGLTASSRTGYWLGVAGGSALLVVFLYPLRKRVAFMRRWGAAKPWFLLHMVCGVCGPLIVLVHSGFHIGSINAGVAMTCMLVVAASGIAGRFIYVRIHHGLSGAHWTLAELNALIGASDAQVHSRLAFAPGVERRLHAFREQVGRHEATVGARAMAFVLAAFRARRVRRACRGELAIALNARAAAVGWDADQLHRASVKSVRLVDDYLDAVRRAAQLATYERIFSWWHILHLPLVWLLVLSAIVHVIAVHAY
jgi:hypothetical protein